MGDQLVVAQGGAELGFELQIAHDLLVHGRLEYGDGVVGAAAGALHGVVGVAHEVFGVLEAAAAQRHADARLGIEDVAVELGALGEVGLQVFGEADGFAGVGDVVEEHRELIAADPADHVARAGEGADAGGDEAQEVVASGVAEAVVDDVEAFDVDVQHRKQAAGDPVGVAQGVLQVFGEQGAVGEAGEAVVEGVVEELVFDALAQVDVADRAGHPHGATGVGIVDGHAAGEDPAVAAVGVKDAVLDGELGGFALEVGDHAQAEGFAVFRVQAGVEGVAVVEHGAGRDAEDFGKARGEVGLVAHDVPVPQAVVGGAGGEGVALFAVGELAGGGFELEDARLQGAGHAVEVLAQLGEFVLAFFGQAVGELAGGDGLAAAEQTTQVAGHQIAHGTEQQQGEQHLGAGDGDALAEDLALGEGERRDGHPELHEADLVAFEQHGAADVDEVVGDACVDAQRAGIVGGREGLHVGQAGADAGLAGGVDDADVDQAFVGLVEEFAEGVLQIVVAPLGYEGGGDDIEDGCVLGDQRVEARRRRLVHETPAVGEQQREHHDLDHGAGQQEANADREVAQHLRRVSCKARGICDWSLRCRVTKR